MDMLDAMLAWLPSLTDLVIYGAMASAAGAIYIISFMGIVGSFYRDTSPSLPATRALAAALALMAPLAVLLMVAFALAESRGLYMVYSFSTARLLGSLCGTPLLLWPAAVALTAYPPFRDAHMPAPPTEEQLPGEQKAEAAAPPPASTEDHEPPAAQQAGEQKLKAAEEEGAEALPAGAKKEQ